MAEALQDPVYQLLLPIYQREAAGQMDRILPARFLVPWRLGLAPQAGRGLGMGSGGWWLSRNFL